MKIFPKPPMPSSEALAAIDVLKLKSKKREQVRRLAAYVEQASAKRPHKRGGLDWCADPQPEVATAINVSVRTLQELLTYPVFQTERAQVGEERRVASLIRIVPIGQTPKLTPETIACGMRREFLTRYGEAMKAHGSGFTSEMHGCFVGLAQLWPDGAQMDIFKIVLDDWTGFMSGAQIVIEAKIKAGLDPKAEKKFWKFPSPSVMRRFWGVAIQLAAMKAQEELVAESAKAGKFGTFKMLTALEKSYLAMDEWFGHLTPEEVVALDDAKEPIDTTPSPPTYGAKLAMDVQ